MIMRSMVQQQQETTSLLVTYKFKVTNILSQSLVKIQCIEIIYWHRINAHTLHNCNNKFSLYVLHNGNEMSIEHELQTGRLANSL